MLRRDLPPLLGGSFTISDARDAGVSRSRLAAVDLVRPFHGVRTRRTATAPGPDELLVRERMAQYAVRMDDGEFYSHISGAFAWGIPLPFSLRREWEQLDVSVHWPRRSPRSRGIRGHAIQSELATVRVHPVTGYAVASPATTWAMLGSVLRHPYDLVAAGDAVVRTPQHRDDPPPLATLEELTAAVAAGRRTGIAALRAALSLIRGGSASRPETWLRLSLVDGGLPEPELNVDVFEDGVWLARVDMAYLALKIAIEYEGEHHLRDPVQWAADIARYDRLEASGWRVIRVTKIELFERPGALRARVLAALRSRC
ncbi:endonuclease domain-containing protein [Microbacterium sp. 18062]|uniref:endonuclease domain-containing protein n=1 Tax=Microbacterium sp. 18062 TaxID=2681410 RepID=UPI00135BB1CB|nr:hypothetical protein [Microbacterium sp. 18062]